MSTDSTFKCGIAGGGRVTKIRMMMLNKIEQIVNKIMVKFSIRNFKLGGYMSIAPPPLRISNVE